MALKDLTTDKAKVTEEQIEGIVSQYVRFDLEAREIISLPGAPSLSNRAKVLVYLVALQAWPLLGAEDVPTKVSPAQLGGLLNIPGGTLRPTLKELKDSNLISVDGRDYFVRTVAFPHIKKAIENTAGGSSTGRRHKKAGKKKTAPNKSDKKGNDSVRKKSTASTGEKTEFFEQLTNGSFFDEPRSLSDVKEAFHQKGHILPSTSLPGYLLKAVRGEKPKLRRERQEVDGKKVWMYEKA
ncbi:MAG: hypothetical protein O2807_02590 [bacterium]|nr:hypothetical protein [bacterium]